ncbi:hypothetical protein VB780_10820 [Leptolyngbya sp. CCNP1308]|uniref:hypothetical protein n=1 Tax=Leptolyngbya sp. CCNP1308 TaxID=3110255 RepID=UPI002B213289|nr:hypothetical protein [Leptolyngbya sp. CCNP1308]MEA5449063.1 hypothetical protein [Leptolyngbya sp. CCNP1308]
MAGIAGARDEYSAYLPQVFNLLKADANAMLGRRELQTTSQKFRPRQCVWAVIERAIAR